MALSRPVNPMSPQRAQPRAQHDNSEDHLLIVGCAGSGKSATGNSILLNNHFEESSQPVSSRKLPKTVTADPLGTGQCLTVTDTPDISETWLNSSTAEGMYFLSQISPGPHAILVVISSRMRISSEIENKLKMLCNALGESATSHMIIVFTSIDCLKCPLEEYVALVREKNMFMNSLLEKCSMQYIGFDNSINPLQQTDKAKAQLEKILMMVKQKGQFQRYKIPFVEKVEKAMLMLDMKTGSREVSRNKLSQLLGLDDPKENNSQKSGMYTYMRFINSKKAVVYGVMVGVLMASASLIGFKDSAIMTSGGLVIVYFGSELLHQLKNNSYTKLMTAIDNYQPKAKGIN